MHSCIWDEINTFLEPEYWLYNARDINHAEHGEHRTSPEDALAHQLANAAEGVTFKNRKQQLAHEEREQALETELASIEHRLAALAAEIMAEQEAYQIMWQILVS